LNPAPQTPTQHGSPTSPSFTPKTVKPSLAGWLGCFTVYLDTHQINMRENVRIYI
jgi:hypothetical protein